MRIFLPRYFLKMKIINDKIEVYDGDYLAASCSIKVALSWYLYPIIFVTERRYLEIPGLFAQQGHAQIALPHEQQINWWKCFCSWRLYRKKYLIPFVANLEVRVRTGEFAAGVSMFDL